MSNVAAPTRTKTPWWAKVLLIIVVLALIGAAAFAGLVVGKFLGASEERSVQVIRSITREEQVVLVTAGVTDIKPETAEGLSITIPGLDVLPWVDDLFKLELPGSSRTMLVRYDFDAKLGIEGKDVKIESIGDKAYRISIPEFIYIGADAPDFSVADEANGILSWTTPPIDKFELAEAILDDATVAETIEGARPVLEEQAKSFYSRIITAIDPEVTLEFTFAS